MKAEAFRYTAVDCPRCAFAQPVGMTTKKKTCDACGYEMVVSDE